MKTTEISDSLDKYINLTHKSNVVKCFIFLFFVLSYRHA